MLSDIKFTYNLKNIDVVARHTTCPVDVQDDTAADGAQARQGVSTAESTTTSTGTAATRELVDFLENLPFYSGPTLNTGNILTFLEYFPRLRRPATDVAMAAYDPHSTRPYLHGLRTPLGLSLPSSQSGNSTFTASEPQSALFTRNLTVESMAASDIPPAYPAYPQQSFAQQFASHDFPGPFAPIRSKIGEVRLPCEFTSIYNCPESFAMDDEAGWIEHSEAHLGYIYPEECLCWFCDMRFDTAVTSAGDRLANFWLRMQHIRTHILDDDFKVAEMRPDILLLRHLERLNLISDDLARHLSTYHESHVAYQFPHLQSIAIQKLDRQDTTARREERRRGRTRRRLIRERGKRTLIQEESRERFPTYSSWKERRSVAYGLEPDGQPGRKNQGWFSTGGREERRQSAGSHWREPHSSTGVVEVFTRQTKTRRVVSVVCHHARIRDPTESRSGDTAGFQR